jgi:hypothetical protein
MGAGFWFACWGACKQTNKQTNKPVVDVVQPPGVTAHHMGAWATLLKTLLLPDGFNVLATVAQRSTFLFFCGWCFSRHCTSSLFSLFFSLLEFG